MLTMHISWQMLALLQKGLVVGLQRGLLHWSSLTSSEIFDSAVLH